MLKGFNYSLNIQLKLGNWCGELGYQMKRRYVLKAFQLMQTTFTILVNNNSPNQLLKFKNLYLIPLCYEIFTVFYFVKL